MGAVRMSEWLRSMHAIASHCDCCDIFTGYINIATFNANIRDKR